MEGASTTHKEEDDGQAPRLLDAPVKIQDQEGNDREGLDFMWGTDKVRGNKQRQQQPSAHPRWPWKGASSEGIEEGFGGRIREGGRGVEVRPRRAKPSHVEGPRLVINLRQVWLSLNWAPCRGGF